MLKPVNKNKGKGNGAGLACFADEFTTGLQSRKFAVLPYYFFLNPEQPTKLVGNLLSFLFSFLP